MRYTRVIGPVLAIGAFMAGAASAGGPQITAHAMVAGGGSSASPGGCRRLEATFGEPVGGRSSGGAYSLTTGFQAGADTRSRDSIFRNGFQKCQ